MSIHAFIPRELPPGLAPLTELALDLRWTWSRRSNHLWKTIAPEAWEATRNPWIILQNTPGPRFRELARDAAFRRELEAILEERRNYGSGVVSPSEMAGTGLTLQKKVAYFSMEFGVGEGLPLYAGGLGVLSGDHLKTASDMGIPIVAVGLLYQEGYFRQTVGPDGRQEALYPYNDPTALPIQPELASSGGWLTISLELPGRILSLRVWRANVGRTPLYLLDSNAPANDPFDRGITGKLYGDGPETRLRQELVLGIGGWRLLEALRLDIGACHLNEGHTAFVVLERARTLMQAHGLRFDEALWASRAGNVFTTHTPVEAGFDSFSPSLLARYFPHEEGYLAELGLGFRDLLRLGRACSGESGEPFRPAFLAMRGSARVNAVSALHAETSRRLFGSLFPRWPTDDVPIRHVTNGVHVPSWISRSADEVWTAACGGEPWRGPVDALGAAASIDDRALWVMRGRARDDLVRKVRQRLARQLARHGGRREVVAAAARALDSDVLTLGFARRFATYKRPNLLLRDPDRLRRLLADPHRPVQLRGAGKAHPDDGPGKHLVESWVRFAGRPETKARCIFLEDYDLALAQELVEGVDVWLNTPRKPWEACGTSGMKVLANGGLNLSVADGWWAEAYAPDVGWSLGGDRDPTGDEGDDDARDTETLFQLIEREIVPAFYDRDAEGLPRGWLARVRASLSQLTPRFSANRMLDEYVKGYYRPAEDALAQRIGDGFAQARTLDRWARRLADAWPALRLGRLETSQSDHGWDVTVEVFEDVLEAGDFSVELYADRNHSGGSRRIPLSPAGPLPGTSHGQLFKGSVPDDRPISEYTPRLIPRSTLAALPMELPLVVWHH